jgi:BirA family biotin operon repressor/biotin-[acetyl-CoA-carboxylase] ligase
MLWRFTGAASQLSGLSLAVGVGLARGLERLGAQGVCLKWPNDVLLRQGNDFAKLAGILIELVSDRRGTQVVIGIGINLQKPQGDLPQPAASLNQAFTVLPERHELLAAILVAVAEALETVTVDGFVGLKNEWQARHAWQDQAVQLLSDEATPLLGRCLGADNDGALLLETENGIQRILSGDVSLRCIEVPKS